MKTDKQIHILLVEDDDVDVRALRRSFAKAGIEHPLVVARDGLEALDTLRGSNGADKLPRPYLVLLDLNMPRMSGMELLKELRSDPELRNSIVFVLTTSAAERDRAGAYEHNVSGYILEEGAGGGFDRLAALLTHFLASVEFPPVRTAAHA